MNDAVSVQVMWVALVIPKLFIQNAYFFDFSSLESVSLRLLSVAHMLLASLNNCRRGTFLSLT